jgi:hypothetical protein
VWIGGRIGRASIPGIKVLKAMASRNYRDEMVEEYVVKRGIKY